MGGAEQLEYDRRVNRVIDHIRGHLAEGLTLAELARVAAASPSCGKNSADGWRRTDSTHRAGRRSA